MATASSTLLAGVGGRAVVAGTGMAVALAVALAVVLKAEAALGWPVMLNLWSSGWCSWSGSSHGFTLAPEGTATEADSADCEYTSGTKEG
jgi:hypothetical protein